MAFDPDNASKYYVIVDDDYEEHKSRDMKEYYILTTYKSFVPCPLLLKANADE